MKPNPQPIYLFADSQLLFWSEGRELFLNSIRRLVPRDSPMAAYVGASNGDAPEFYSIFEAAMGGVGVHNRRMILRSFLAEDQSFLGEADIILLAGGDVERGWRVFVETGIREVIIRRYYEGAVLMGISAGAAQLGLYGLVESGASPAGLAGTFGLVPFVIDAPTRGRDGAASKAIRLLDGAAEGHRHPDRRGFDLSPGRRSKLLDAPCMNSRSRGEESKRRCYSRSRERLSTRLQK